MSVKYSDDIYTKFSLARKLNYHGIEGNKSSKENKNSYINSIDFDDSGQFCLSSGVDDTLHLYNCKSGKHIKSVNQKKFGVTLAKFTHWKMNCIFASTKNSNHLRYFSFHDNHFIRYLKGHTDYVNSLEVSPINDTILSASLDNTVKMWDLRAESPQGSLNCKAPSVVAISPESLIFGIVSNETKEIGLYDMRKYDEEPFTTYKLRYEGDVKNMKFSNDGKSLVLDTPNANYHYVVDSFTGEISHRLSGHKPINNSNIIDSGSVTFSPDGKFIFGGSNDGKMLLWDTRNVGSEKRLNPSHVFPTLSHTPRLVAFNPHMFQLITADTELYFWLLDLD